MPIDVTDATFESDVIDRSHRAVVIIDLWAPWCGPCLQLTPLLEKVVAETKGKAELVKINVDENPRSAGAFQVQSIPAVYAMRDGKVVTGFVGALGETAVREFVATVLPSEEEERLASLVAAGGEESLRQALEIDPGFVAAVVPLADLLVERGEVDEALALLERIPESAETRRIAARARVGENGAAADNVEVKLERLLGRVKQDEEARQEYVDILELLGPDDPRTAKYRKALTAKLF